MVDDSHATGFMGANGRFHRALRRAGTRGFPHRHLRQGAGGGSGGYTSGKSSAIAWLRQRSRPYLFSNSIPPVVAAVTMRALDLVENMPELRGALFAHARKFRAAMTAAGFKLLPGEHPIIPIMIATRRCCAIRRPAARRRRLRHRILVPVVPKAQRASARRCRRG